MDKERAIEFLIGIVFIVALILIILLLFNLGPKNNSNENKKDSNEEPQTIINTYYENNYNYPEKSYTGNVVYNSPDYDYVVYKRDEPYLHYEKRREVSGNYCDFSSSGIRKKTKSGASYVDEYYVYVKNQDSVGKYFKVIFHFEENSNPDSFDDDEIMVKYVWPGETRKFVFRDVHFEREHYDYWDYVVFSQDDGFDEAKNC